MHPDIEIKKQAMYDKIQDSRLHRDYLHPLGRCIHPSSPYKTATNLGKYRNRKPTLLPNPKPSIIKYHTRKVALKMVLRAFSSLFMFVLLLETKNPYVVKKLICQRFHPLVQYDNSKRKRHGSLLICSCCYFIERTRMRW